MMEEEQEETPPRSWWLRNSPAANPNLWIALNGACCFASLLIELVFVAEGKTINVLPIYACYNFGTTVVWCFEAAMSLSYACCAVPSQRPGRMVELLGHGLLLSAALYFLATSIFLFQDILEPPEQLGEYELDVLISFFFNCIAIVYVYWEQRRERLLRESTLQPKAEVNARNAVKVVDQYDRLA